MSGFKEAITVFVALSLIIMLKVEGLIFSLYIISLIDCGSVANSNETNEVSKIKYL